MLSDSKPESYLFRMLEGVTNTNCTGKKKGKEKSLEKNGRWSSVILIMKSLQLCCLPRY